MTQVRGKLLASVASLVVIGFVAPASADQLLTGSIASATGQKLDGVQVSAKKEGSTITTSVYTDQNGDYFFPALPDGKYNVWAQALGFETSKGQVDLTATKHQDFKLAAITDPDQKIKQMPSEMLAAALPEDTEADANMKRIFHNQCTGCHTPGYPLQFKFDEAGWNKIINLMKMVAGTGEYHGPERQAQRHHGVQPQGARGLSGAGARTRRDLDEVPGSSASDRRSRPRRVDTPMTCRSTRSPAWAPAAPSTRSMTAPTGAWAPRPSSASFPMTAPWASTAISITPSTTRTRT